MKRFLRALVSCCIVISVANSDKCAVAQGIKIMVAWDTIVTVSKCTPSLQVVVNPMLRRGSPIHESSFKALKNLNAEYVRFVPWVPYPRLAVAALERPTKDKTSWNFELIDPLVEDFMTAMDGRSTVMNFSTAPVWLFKMDTTIHIPSDPNELFWNYTLGTEFVDTTLKELTDYYVRLFSWYTKGGFTDELGKFHKSPHRYKFPYWEVFNEVESEHELSAELYTMCYDAIVKELKKIFPETKFVGITLGLTSDVRFYEYFLTPSNHDKDVTIEGISYHFYALGADKYQTVDQLQYSFFDQAYAFIEKVRYIQNMRSKLSPQAFTTVNEIGTILTNYDYPEERPIPDAYWNLSASMFAHIYVELTKLGIEVANQSQLVGYPTQYPEVSMINWKNGKPNARYWVLKLLIDNFGPGDKLVKTLPPERIYRAVSAQAYSTKSGRKLLLINKRNRPLKVHLPPEFNNGEIHSVDSSTVDREAEVTTLKSSTIILNPFSVSVIKIKNP